MVKVTWDTTQTPGILPPLRRLRVVRHTLVVRPPSFLGGLDRPGTRPGPRLVARRSVANTVSPRAVVLGGHVPRLLPDEKNTAGLPVVVPHVDTVPQPREEVHGLRPSKEGASSLDIDMDARPNMVTSLDAMLRLPLAGRGGTRQPRAA